MNLTYQEDDEPIKEPESPPEEIEKEEDEEI